MLIAVKCIIYDLKENVMSLHPKGHSDAQKKFKKCGFFFYLTVDVPDTFHSTTRKKRMYLHFHGGINDD